MGGAVDFIWGFPLILLAVLFAGGMGGGLLPVILAVGLVNTAAIARVVRGEVLTLSQREFVEAARAGGYSSVRIMWRHIFPNILAPAFVLASYYVAVAVIAEAALSFIGLGAQPPTPSLGQLVADGRNFLRLNHWESDHSRPRHRARGAVGQPHRRRAARRVRPAPAPRGQVGGRAMNARGTRP